MRSTSKGGANLACSLLTEQDTAVVEGTAFNRFTDAGLARVTVRLAAPTQIPVATLGSLRGRVLGPYGQPVPHIRVELFRIQAASGLFSPPIAKTIFRGQAGTGAYRLRARPALASPPLGQKPENVTPLPAHPLQEGHWMWAPTYFPTRSRCPPHSPLWCMKARNSMAT